MTILKFILAGVCLALAGVVIVLYWQYLLMGIVVLLALAWIIDEARKPAAPISAAEMKRRRQSFINYQISQDMAERREAFREAQAQWQQQQQPPPRDPSSWGGGDGGRFC